MVLELFKGKEGGVVDLERGLQVSSTDPRWNERKGDELERSMVWKAGGR